jgi:fibronectin type 3 domain-containing protein
MKTKHGLFFGFAVLALTAMFALAGCDDPTRPMRPGSEGGAPAAPTGILATAQSSSSINVSWGSVSGASGYRVYRATSSGGYYSNITSTSGAYYTDSGLSSNTTYYYKVSAWNDYGESSQSSYASATTSAPGMPATPANVTAEAQSSSSINVSWGSVSGASGYRVYRANSSGGYYSVVDSTSSTSYTDTGLSSNTTYYYKVSAWNDYGESSQSSYDYATTSGGSGVPATPTDVVATAQSSSSISVSWGSVSGASGYRVYRASSSGGYYSELGSTYGTSYTDNGLSSNTTYYYKVSAWNAYGEGSQSSYASATTSAPGMPATPTDVVATAQSSSSISVSWGFVSGASGYRVYRADSSSGYYSVVDSTSDTFYTDTGLSSNTAYYYKVSAYNSAGEGDQSYYTSATTPVNAPANVMAEAQSSSSIMVSWDYVSGANSYSVYRSNSSDGYYSELGSTYGTSYTDNGLSSNTTYYYKVSAGNAYGKSALSDYVPATTFVGVPSGVTATAQSSSSISLAWSQVSGATGYRVYRADNSGGSYSVVDSTSDTFYTDTGLSSNTTYSYKVSAYNSVGEGEQSYDTASATTFVDAPTGVTAEAQSPSSIYVSWEPVDGASGYRVYRSTNSYGDYSLIANYLSVTSYTDTERLASTTYYYEVSAYNSAGENARSSYTSASTPPEPGALSIIVGFNLGAITIAGSDGTNLIRPTGFPPTLTLSAEGYDNVVWYVDGDVSAPASGNTITIDARNYDVRNHSVTFRGHKNGTPYAQVIPFTVLN